MTQGSFGKITRLVLLTKIKMADVLTEIDSNINEVNSLVSVRFLVVPMHPNDSLIFKLKN